MTKFKVYVKCFIKYKDKVLILKKSQGSKRWHLPGGGLEPDETLEQGIIREIKEETGIVITSVDYIKSEGFKYNDKQFIGAYFEALVDSDKVILSEEHTDFAWVDKTSIKEYELVHKESNRILSLFECIF